LTTLAATPSSPDAASSPAAAAGRRRRRRPARRARRAGLNLLGLLVALITLFPIFWMVSTAFKPATEWYSLTPHPLPRHPTLGNFRAVIDGSVIGLPYWNFLKNSLFVTVVAVVASSLIALLAAIALARFRFRFRTTYLIMLLIVQMLPQQALVIALFLDFRSLSLLDSLVGLILVYTAFALPGRTGARSWPPPRCSRSRSWPSSCWSSVGCRRAWSPGR
jgi:ABC-type glycerol-3-phosphate transport system permease component